MADASRDVPPPGWGDAFAALPLDAPPVSRWPAIEAALDDAAVDEGDASHARRTHAHTRATWPRRLAWAAVLAAVALPALFWLRPGEVAPSRTPFATAPAAPAPTSAVVAATATKPSPAPTAIPVPPTTAKSTHAPAARIARAPVPVAHDPMPSQAKPWPRARIATEHAEEDALQAAFEPYYAESARLERVIASTRDPRVGSGPAASLAGALDAELAAVDARLAQPGLDAGQRLALWRERVDVLRASAEFESQLRLLAVEGDVLDGALVRVD